MHRNSPRDEISEPLLWLLVPRADLWGDDISYASQMESTGVPEHVQISSTTYAKVKDVFEVTPREVPTRGPAGMKRIVNLQMKDFSISATIFSALLVWQAGAAPCPQ